VPSFLARPGIPLRRWQWFPLRQWLQHRALAASQPYTGKCALTLQPTDVYCPSSPACPSPWCHSRLDRGSRLPIVAGNDATMALRAGDLWSLGHFAKVLHNDRPPTTLQCVLACTRGRNQGVVYSDGLSTALQRVSPCSSYVENAKTAMEYVRMNNWTTPGSVRFSRSGVSCRRG